ncbi:Abi family protein [Robinsoniella peoriensis]|uniref:Abi family protein n=1 Tax=Robinsoniella peoriensis TaxID=180332 RepID=UPI0036256355
MSYKTIDGLMRHLRDNGIAISGSSQKRQLRNTGYFHGYKGYRFFKNAQNSLPFVSYDEVYATIQYDSSLKALLYGKMMYIETAVKNIALESILDNAKSESIQDMFDKVVSGYNNAPTTFTTEQRKKLQQNKLNLQNSVQSSLAYAYRKDNPKITHFYNNADYSGVPVWALFEIMTMGDLGYLLSCLTYDVRDDISKRLGINVSSDTNRQLIFKYIYTLKDLRNAIAHNAVVFDTRFRNIDPTSAMKQCLINEMGLPYVNFKTIGDYVILMCYYMKLLGVSKTEIKAFIREFEKITEDYRKAVNVSVAAVVIHPDWTARMILLKNFL